MTTEELRRELEKSFVAKASANKVFDLTPEDRDKEFSSLFATNGVIATIIYVVAVVINLRNQLFDKWKEEIKSLYESSRYGTWAWWIDTAKRWQYGYATSVIDSGEVGYENIDENARIIKAAMVRQSGRSLSVYVAKQKSNDLLALTEEELEGFQQYCDNVKPLGVHVVAVSKKADEVNVEADVVYNGELTQDAIKKAVQEKLNEYVRSLQFGATIYKAQMIEEVMSIEGMVDVDLKVNIVVEEVVNELERSFVLSAGYGVVKDINITLTRDNSVRR